MPYTMDNMPESMKGAPQQAMEIFIAAFNSAFEKNHVEGAAMAIAMAAVHKAGYKMDEQGQWMSNRRDTEHRVPTMGDHAELVPESDRGWIPIFRTGTHTDSAGNTKAWTEAELDLIVGKYKPQDHEAPAVIGHPEHNSPAWGWVEGLRREGNILFAKFKGLIPEFVEMVRKGVFKKRSISLYPDTTLRHVGFLGAMPPAVKGLTDVAFADKDKQVIEFTFDCKQCNRCRDTEPRVPTINNFCWKEAKRMKWFDWLKVKATAEGVTLEDAPSFSEPGRGTVPVPSLADVKALVDAQVATQVAAKQVEFAEALKTETQKLATQKADLDKEKTALDKAKADKTKADIVSFCEGLCKEGKLTPAMMKYGMGMTNFLEAISGVETAIEFSEGTEKKKQTPFEYAQSFLGSFKKQIEFGEFAGNAKDFAAKGDEAKREQLITNYMEKNDKATYKDSVLVISKKHPELFKT